MSEIGKVIVIVVILSMLGLASYSIAKSIQVGGCLEEIVENYCNKNYDGIGRLTGYLSLGPTEFTCLKNVREETRVFRFTEAEIEGCRK